MDTNCKPAAFRVEMVAITPMGGVGRDDFYRLQEGVNDVAAEIAAVEKTIEDSKKTVALLETGLQEEVVRAKKEEGRLEKKIDDKTTTTKYIYHEETTVKIKPNVMNVWGRVQELKITFEEAETNDFIEEFLIRFTASSQNTILELPEDIKWFEEIYIQPNYTYEISILDKLAVWAEYR